MNDGMKLFYIKLFLGTILSVFLLFFTWKASYSYHCISLIFPLIMLFVISRGYIELKMEERSCFKKCYFKENTFFSRILTSRFFVTIFYLLLSIVMTISTFLISIDFSILLWSYFIVHILLSVLLFRYLNHLFKNTFHDKYQLIFAREWTIRIMTVLLIVVFIYISLNEYTPVYLSHSLSETVNNATNAISSSCDVINVILKFGKTVDSSFWWVVYESTEQVNNTLIKTGIWFAFLFYNSLALLGINRLMLQIIYMLNNLFDNAMGKQIDE